MNAATAEAPAVIVPDRHTVAHTADKCRHRLDEVNAAFATNRVVIHAIAALWPTLPPAVQKTIVEGPLGALCRGLPFHDNDRADRHFDEVLEGVEGDVISTDDGLMPNDYSVRNASATVKETERNWAAHRLLAGVK